MQGLALVSILQQLADADPFGDGPCLGAAAARGVGVAAVDDFLEGAEGEVLEEGQEEASMPAARALAAGP